MKALKISCLLIIILGSSVLFMVQDIPEKVRKAFSAQFPQAIALDWEQESEGEWEADFKINGILYSAKYLQDGTWMETEYEIDKKDIPDLFWQALETSFPGYKLKESEKLETSQGAAYEFELENGDIEIEVIMDLKGKVLRTEVESENEDE